MPPYFLLVFSPKPSNRLLSLDGHWKSANRLSFAMGFAIRELTVHFGFKRLRMAAALHIAASFDTSELPANGLTS